MRHVVAAPAVAAGTLPRLGFLGLGWIGLARLRTLAATGTARVNAIADTSPQRTVAAVGEAPGAAVCDSLDALLDQDLDGIVIATPTALHAQQSIRALERGLAVFCQKPLARTAPETTSVIAAARSADRLLGVDLSYRYSAAMRAVREIVSSGAIGDVFAADLSFHNAYGPDKDWARDPVLAGGGCVIDLGIHLIDLALWVLSFPGVAFVQSRLYARGRLLPPGAVVCEDYASATIDLETGTTLRLSCSWEMSAGRGASIEVFLHGTRGGVAMRNVNGSFFDFVAEQYDGAHTSPIAAPPDDWPGRALLEWNSRLAHDRSYDTRVETLVPVAATVDRMLAR